MSTSTVGELIEFLTKFDPSLPVLTGDESGFGYTGLSLPAIMVCKVRRVLDESGGDCDFVDAIGDLDIDNSLDAVVL